MLAPVISVLLLMSFTQVQAFAASDDTGFAVVSGCATEQMGLLTLVLPKVTGKCVGSAWITLGRKDPVTGQGVFVEQKTSSGGLLVTCAFSGWTAFTDGQMTYIGGPFGVMWRKNNAVLPYPYDQACIPPPPPAPSTGGSSGPSDSSGSGMSCVNNISIVNGAGSQSVNTIAAAACSSNASIQSAIAAPTGSGANTPASHSPSPSTSSVQTSSTGSGSGS